MRSRAWTYDELLVAFNMYCRIPFGKLHKSNPEIIALAKILNRTPSALAMKLVNFASLDPTHKARKVRGLIHIAHADKDIWNEFNADWEKLAYESQQALNRLGLAQERETEREKYELQLAGKETETSRISRVRLVQSFFRDSVLANYEYRCAFCSLQLADLLVASHIIPWSHNVGRRADPRNGISLCAIHDKAFDRGYLGLDDEFKVLVATAAKVTKPSKLHFAALLEIEGQHMTLPNRFLPDLLALTYHRENIFRH